MMDRNGRREYWRSRIPSDLRSFGDAGELVDLGDAGSDLRARWTMLGEAREALFSFSGNGSVSVLFDGKSSSYGSFLAGPRVGDLEQVARRIARVPRPERFVETEAALAGKGDPEPAVELLSRMIETPTGTATRLVILTGGAGAGKTTVLRELVARQADRYLRGETKRLLLYVNAQGRSLARFNEALALELQELRAPLTGHSVASLAREGLVVPVMDGLDELLGVSGYDDAFASVSTFLDAMEGEGCVLAAARSTYYEEEFVSRASESWRNERARWRQVPVRLRGWAETQQTGFVERWAAAKALTDDEREAVSGRLTRLFSGKCAGFGRRPFFFARAAELASRSTDFRRGGDLLREIVEEYLERDRLEKLPDRHIAPMLTRHRFRLLMQKLALQMWLLETRELDGSSLRGVVDDLAETEDLSEEYRRALVERLPSLALLSRGEGHGGRRRVAFEHELFFFHFLSDAMVSLFASPEQDAPAILGRGALPDEVAVRVAKGLRDAGREDGQTGAQRLLDRLRRAGSGEWRRAQQVRENAGLLAMAMFREGAWVEDTRDHGPAVAHLVVRGMVFPGGDLRGVTFFRCAFEEVTMRRTDLAETRFVECEAKRCVLVAPRLDPERARLDLRGLSTGDVHGIRLPGTDRSAYAPEVVRETLRRCGARVAYPAPGSAPQVDPGVVLLMERLARVFGRANPVCLQDDGLREVLGSPEWVEVKRRLLRHEIAVPESRETRSGPMDFLRRRFRPDQIMAGLDGAAEVDPRIRLFWKSLESPARGDGCQPEAR